jgi:hypothetical protein
MADSTIANLPSGSPAQTSDQLPIQRSSSTLKILVSDILSGVAPLASPELSGTPTAPTASPLTDNTQLATTAYADAAVAAAAAFNFLYPHLVGFSVAQVIEPVTATTSSGGAINYTVPAGMRAVVELWGLATTNTADSVKLQVQIGGSGSWYSVSPAASLSSGATPIAIANPFSTQNNFIFEAGDVISVLSTAGVNLVYGTIFTFSNTSPLKTPRLSGTISIGVNQPIYTCPSGKHAIHFAGRVADTTNVAGSYTTTNTNAENHSVLYRVQNGAIPTTGDQRLSTGAGSAVGINAPAFSACSFASLSPGDYVSVIFGGCFNPTVSSVLAASGGNTVYNTASLGATTNEYVGMYWLVLDFHNAANNGTFQCVANTNTTLTLNNPIGVAETNTAVCMPLGYLGSSVANSSSGSAVYQVTLVGSTVTGNTPGNNITVTGFSNASNNGTFLCTAATATSLTLSNPNAVAETPGTPPVFMLASLPAALLYVNNVLEF